MTTRHIRALDGVRGLAILLVIPHNCEGVFEKMVGLFRIEGVLASAGWIGVQLFFVLSGFLITRNLLDSQGTSNYFRVFFARRVLRIFPLYYATLLVTLVIVPLAMVVTTGSAGTHLFQHDQIWLWTFLLNWAHPFGVSTFGLPHFWSLAVEEQFYFVWPFVVWYLAPRSLLRACAGIAVAALLARTALHFLGGTNEMIYEFTVCRMDALAIGAATAAILRYPSGIAWMNRWQPSLVPMVAVLTVVTAAVTKIYSRDLLATQTIGYSLLAILFAVLLLACVAQEGKYNLAMQRVFDWNVLRSVGKYSYGMYVLHYPLVAWLQRYHGAFTRAAGPWATMSFAATITVLSYGAALVSYYGLEKPFLRLKGRFVPHYERPLPVSATPAA